MADKIAKLLASLQPKQLRLLLPVIDQVLSNNFKGLNIKALKGRKGFFRVRVGNYRIIFKVQKNQKVNIVFIGKRNEKTYKDL